MQDKTMGITLFKGVVEDNLDPDFLGRVRVRIFGLHTEKNENSGDDFEFVQTDHLPWAQVMGSTSLGLIGGVGVSSVLRNGTWVWVTLEGDPNSPVVMGTIPGINTTPGTGVYTGGKGFSDPLEIYPQPARTVDPGETDFNRLSTAQKLDDEYYEEPCPIIATKFTIHKKINDTQDVQEEITDDITGADVSQTEPLSTNELTVYPDAMVIETHSGHVIETDDTPGNERIRVAHRTGSYIEIKPDGTFVQKGVNVEGISHFIHMNDVNEHIAKGVKRYIETNLEEIILGSVLRNIQTDLNEHIAGEVARQVDKNVTETVTGAITITPSGHLKIDSDVIITGNVQIDGATFGAGNITSGAEVADSAGNVSSVRLHSDTHVHTGNMGAPTTAAMQPDPKTRAGDTSVTLAPV